MNDFKLMTGYFSKSADYAKKGYFLISIAKYPPRWFSGSRYPVLAPNKLDYESREAYISDFSKKLSTLNQNAVVNTLKRLSNMKPVVLLCFEKPEEFCHRHLVADWLNKAIPTLQVDEIDKPKPTSNHGEQASLF